MGMSGATVWLNESNGRVNRQGVFSDDGKESRDKNGGGSRLLHCVLPSRHNVCCPADIARELHCRWCCWLLSVVLKVCTALQQLILCFCLSCVMCAARSMVQGSAAEIHGCERV